MQILPRIKAAVNAFALAPQKEVGTPGTEIYSGYIRNEDHNQTFDDEEVSIEIFEKMRREEPKLKGLLRAVKLPILAAEPRIDAVSDARIDQQIADEVADNLFNNRNFTYNQWLKDVLLHLDYGFSLLEKSFEIINGRTRWKRFSHRKQKTICRWKTSDRGLEWVEQQAFDAITEQWKTVQIPGMSKGYFGNKLFHIANDMEGLNYRGESLLRPCYRSYIHKGDAIRRQGIQQERGAIGTPVVTYTSGNPSDEVKDLVGDVMEDWRTGAKSYIEKTQHFDIDIIGGKDFFGLDLIPIMRYHDDEMVSSFLAAFLEAGKNATGSYSKQKSDIELFLDNLDSILNHIEDIMNNGNLGMQHLKQLVDFNYPNVTDYPKYRGEKINGLDWSVIAESLVKISNIGGLHFNEEDEMFLREKFGMPERDLNDLKRETEERQKQRHEMFQPSKDDEEEKIEGRVFPGLRAQRMRKVPDDVLMFESKVLDAWAISNKIDTVQDEMKAEAAKFRDQMVSELISRARNKFDKIKSVADLKEVINKTPVPAKSKMIKSLTGKGKEIFRFGRESVRNEIAKQKDSGAIAEGIAEDPLNAIMSVKTTTELAIEEFTQKLKGAWGSELASQYKSGVLDERGLLSAMERISQNVFNKTTDELAIDSMGLGREVELIKQGISRVIRSEILDTNTCGPCFDVDGQQFVVGGPDYHMIANGPYSDCDGKGRCRGLNVAIVDE